MASVVQNVRLSAENSESRVLPSSRPIPRESSSSSGSSDSEERTTLSAAMLAGKKTASPQQHKRRKVKSFKDRSKTSVASPKRKTLQTLQLTAKPGQLARNNTILRFLDKKSTKRKSCSDGERNKPVKLPRADLASRTSTTTPVIYNDQDSSNESSSSDDSKSLAQEALDIMKNEPTSELYWQDVAEERRLALVDTLKENKELHQQLEEKKAVIKEKEAVIQDLTDENETLKEMAKQAEDILSILKPITEDEENPGSKDKVADDASTSSSSSHAEEGATSSHPEEGGATSCQEGSDSS